MDGKARVGRSCLHTSRASLSLLNMKGVSSKSHFSLSEEARNTERHHSWNSDLKLRHSRVAFVSAGASKAEDLTQIPQEQAEERSEELQDSAKGTRDGLAEALGKQSTSAPPIVVPEIPMSSMSLSDAYGVNLGLVAHDPINVEVMREKGFEKETANSDNFFTDVNGSGKTYTGLTTPTVRRSPSFAASDSSEEIILFAGRKASRTQAHKELDFSRKSGAQPLSERTKPTPRTTTTVSTDLVGINLDGAISIPEASSQRLPIAAHIPESLPFVEKNVGPDRRKRRRRKGEKRSKKAEDDAKIFADYIANTRDSQELGTFARSSAYNRRDLGGSDDQWQDDEEASVVEKQVDNADIDAIEWDSADLQDFDELSTSSEALPSIEQILSKRERISGVQYLVVGEGYTVDDARWLPISLLHISGADEQIQLFEQEQAEHERLFEGSEDSQDVLKRDGNVAIDLHDDLDNLEDEHDLKERGKDRMTDEQIARLLAKQEELGLGSSDLLLFDGEDFADDRMGEIPLDGTLVQKFQPQPRPKRNKRYQDTFPSATLFADVLQQDPYNGFDVMDQERPSLRKRPKGRRGKFTPALSDSEFEQSITIAWEKDRAKKRIRKQEREESRMQGLLGKKDKVDMKAKYAEGMSMDEVKCEIREFLLSSMERYTELVPLFY